MAEPILQAAAQILDEQLDGMREALDGIPLDAIGWRPAGDDTNTIAVLAAHAMHSTRWWLSIAVGAPLPDRDRPSEFLGDVPEAEDLRASFETLAAECRSLVGGAATFEPGAERTSTSPSRAERSEPPETVTAAWALLHALEHLREHVAHAQLTRQLWEAREPGTDGR